MLLLAALQRCAHARELADIFCIPRVSNDLGAGSPSSAKRAAWTAAAMSVGVMSVLAVPAVLFRWASTLSVHLEVPARDGKAWVAQLES